MASYLLDSEIDLVRMEGDDSDVEITIDESLSIAGSDVTFEIHDRNGDAIISKTNAVGGGITIAGQTITVTLLPADSTGYAGVHRYEFKIVTDLGKTYRICRGTFEFLEKTVA